MTPLVSHSVVGVVAAVVGAAIAVGIALGTRPGCVDDSLKDVAVDMMRPAFHYTPRFGWVNDPNGLVYYEGEWHLHYQADYETSLHGNMSWGHAVSTDLTHWQELPIAISYDKDEQIFSGSAVVDANCTSGLCENGEPVLIAIYTSFQQAVDSTNRHIQRQHIASSKDRGRTWTKYDKNPVLDKQMHEFRDPKVSRQGDHWLMLVQKSEEHVLQFYKSTDLKHWGDGNGGDGPAGEFGPMGATGGVWECPDMFRLPVDGNENNAKWVLIVNINPGNRFQGYGSGAQFFIGNFDGDAFHADTAGEYSWLDWGADNYATITWDNAPNGEVIAIGWMSNWNYTHLAPGSTWRNSFTVPRLVELITIDGKVRLVQNPVKNIDSLRNWDNYFSATNLKITEQGGYSEPTLRGRAVDIVVEFDAGSATEFGVKVYQGKNQETLIGYDTNLGQVYVDRRMSGTVNFHPVPEGAPSFADRHGADLPLTGGKLKLRILVDHGSVEVFANKGEVAITDVIFPDPFKDSISFYAVNGTATVDSVAVFPMETIHGML